MHKIHFLACVLVCCLVTYNHTVMAQIEDTPKQDSTYKQGLRLGIDVTNFTSFVQNNKTPKLDFTADYGMKSGFVATEFGYHKYQVYGNGFDYNSNGAYLKLGYDYNLFGADDDVLFIGGRFCTANETASAKNITLPAYQTATYNDGFTTASVDSRKFSAQWAEAVAGLKVRVISQLYLGFTMRLGRKLHQTDYQELKPLHLPGYGLGDNLYALGFNYYLSFKIPLIKRQIQAPSGL